MSSSDIEQMQQAIGLGDVTFAWHQYFNNGSEPVRILSHSPRPAMDNVGLQLTQQGESADY